MSDAIRQLQPSALWGRFADLNAIPRASGKEEAVCQWIKGLAQSMGLDVSSDSVGNVLVRKPASAGMEDRKTVILQSHVDMVHQKNNETVFDFDSEGIRMYVDGDWVRAEGTTLGADNGLGVATMLAIMESGDTPHPPLELLFTIDEETGMTGALELQRDWMDGEILLNLDTEDDREIGIGCAGGIDLGFSGTLETCVPRGNLGLNVVIKGGSGGHSGMDIHKGIANANKILVRVVREMEDALGDGELLELATLDGGGLRNAIPREAQATLSTNTPASEWQVRMAPLLEHIRAEYRTTDPGLDIQFHHSDKARIVLTKSDGQTLLAALDCCPNGIDRMSPDIPGLVQTSNNLARIRLTGGEVEVHCLTRSSVDTEKMDLARRIETGFTGAGLDATRGGAYPGWTPDPDSEVVRMMTELYRELHGEEPMVLACHAGLECGIIGSRYPGLDMVSFGPTILGAHSPDERASISSTLKYWGWLKEALLRTPKRA